VLSIDEYVVAVLCEKLLMASAIVIEKVMFAWQVLN
jgi:hypothetical protein